MRVSVPPAVRRARRATWAVDIAGTVAVVSVLAAFVALVLA